MIVTQITDCKDANALGRTESRLSSLLQCPVNSIGVSDDLQGTGNIEAAGNLIEILDAVEDREAIVIVNVAPRQGEAKQWQNGTPFSWFTFKNTKVISSIQGVTLSLVKKLQLVESVNLIDIPKVLPFVLQQGLVAQEVADRILHTQFRSFDYLPRIAHWLSQDIQLPSEAYSLTNIPNMDDQVWYVDNFGNVKTTILAEEIQKDGISTIDTQYGTLPIYNRLKDVPNSEVAAIAGSSGIGSHRFLELVIQGASFAKRYNVKVGDRIR